MFGALGREPCAACLALFYCLSVQQHSQCTTDLCLSCGKACLCACFMTRKTNC
jgi:hypothetical protein